MQDAEAANPLPATAVAHTAGLPIEVPMLDTSAWREYRGQPGKATANSTHIAVVADEAGVERLCFVKLAPNLNKPTLLCEALGWVLAGHAGLQRANFGAIILVDKGRLAKNQELTLDCAAFQGDSIPAWCSEAIPGNSVLSHAKSRSKPGMQFITEHKTFLNSNDARKFAAFDQWTGLRDRNMGNVIRHKAGGYASIDHETMLHDILWGNSDFNHNCLVKHAEKALDAKRTKTFKADMTRAPKPGFAGWWSYIEFQPDIVSPQRFPIGVVVQAEDERLYFKLLDDFKKFDCVYPEGFPHSSAKALMAYAYDELQAAIKAKAPLGEILFDSHVLSISRPAHTSGMDREATVERLFGDVVAMVPSNAKKTREFESVDTTTARKLVNEKLKEISGMDFERFVMVDHPGLLIRGDGEDRHYLDLNLLTPKSCGAVTSAVYKSHQSVEMNLLKASLDLKTCRSVKQLESAGLFLLTPNPDLMEPREYRRIEDAIGEHEWKLERDGFRVVSMQEPSDLAREIYDWAKPALA